MDGLDDGGVHGQRESAARRMTSRAICRCRSAARTSGGFSDGEVTVEIMENVRGRDVFIVQSTSRPRTIT